MAAPGLPNTGIRLATGTSFYTLREDAISLATFFKSVFSPRTTITSIEQSMQQVLGLVSFMEDQNRTSTPRWETDSDVLGQPLEILTSPVTRSFRIKRAVKYTDDLITILGFEKQIKDSSQTLDGGVLAQTAKTPFIFIKQDRAPDGSGIAPTVTFYRGCSISSLTREYDVSGGDLSVYEDANIFYALRQQFTQ